MSHTSIIVRCLLLHSPHQELGFQLPSSIQTADRGSPIEGAATHAIVATKRERVMKVVLYELLASLDPLGRYSLCGFLLPFPNRDSSKQVVRRPSLRGRIHTVIASDCNHRH